MILRTTSSARVLAYVLLLQTRCNVMQLFSVITESQRVQASPSSEAFNTIFREPSSATESKERVLFICVACLCILIDRFLHNALLPASATSFCARLKNSWLKASSFRVLERCFEAWEWNKLDKLDKLNENYFFISVFHCLEFLVVERVFQGAELKWH